MGRPGNASEARSKAAGGAGKPALTSPRNHLHPKWPPATWATKQIRDTSEFIRKDGLLSGRVPSMFPSAEVLRIQHRMANSR